MAEKGFQTQGIKKGEEEEQTDLQTEGVLKWRTIFFKVGHMVTLSHKSKQLELCSLIACFGNWAFSSSSEMADIVWNRRMANQGMDAVLTQRKPAHPYSFVTTGRKVATCQHQENKHLGMLQICNFECTDFFVHRTFFMTFPKNSDIHLS